MVYKHTITSAEVTLTTFSFNVFSTEGEMVITGELKQQLNIFVPPAFSISNGNVTISNDGTNMKLINSAPSVDLDQHGTFTFYDYTGDVPGGGGSA